MNKYRGSHCLFIKALLKIEIVRLSKPILRLVLLAALGAAPLFVGCDKAPTAGGGGDNPPPPSSSPPQTGNGSQSNDGTGTTSSAACTSYNVLVRGDFTGGGTANASSASVSVSAQVTDSTGATGTLTLSAPVVNQRFSGSGSVLGQTVTFSGRIDPADVTAAKGSVLRSPRLVGTFSTQTGRFGRVAGQTSAANK
jgi:hypothetical protein